MSISSNKIGQVRLSSSVTVSQYREMESSKDRAGLADFIEHRLLERYVLPVTQTCQKNGFLMVAASCLLIETLESFYRGWESTEKSINLMILRRHVVRRISRRISRRAKSRSAISFSAFPSSLLYVQWPDHSTRTFDAAYFIKAKRQTVGEYSVRARCSNRMVLPLTPRGF